MPSCKERGDTTGWGTAVQATMWQVRFPLMSLEFFIDIFLTAALWPWGWLILQQKLVPGIFPGEQKRPVRRANKLTTCMCWLSWNLGASTSRIIQCLSRSIMELLYRYIYVHVHVMWRSSEWGQGEGCRRWQYNSEHRRSQCTDHRGRLPIMSKVQVGKVSLLV